MAERLISSKKDTLFSVCCLVPREDGLRSGHRTAYSVPVQALFIEFFEIRTRWVLDAGTTLGPFFIVALSILVEGFQIQVFGSYLQEPTYSCQYQTL